LIEGGFLLEDGLSGARQLMNLAEKVLQFLFEAINSETKVLKEEVLTASILRRESC